MNEKYRMTVRFKILTAQFALSFIGVSIGCIWGLNIENEKWSYLIRNNIKIANINLGGKTKEEARRVIEAEYIEPVLKRKLYITIGNKVYSASKASLIKNYDIDNVIDKAFKFEKSLGLFERFEFVNKGKVKNFNLNFSCNEHFIKEFTRNIENNINQKPLNATIAISFNGIIKLGTDTAGYRIETDKLNKYIEYKLKNKMNQDIYIKAPFHRIEAKVTKKALSQINTCIASFSTSFQNSSFSRSNNINICVKAINGKVLMPGEIFSFNNVVGARTKERGYMEAPVIIHNKVESGIGGGICQVSSTLYNAILRSGIENIERTHHSLPSSYVGLGLDATVDWGNIDFKFKNTLDYPIYIEGYTRNKKLYINIFSNSILNKRKYIIENNSYRLPYSITENKSECKVKVIRKTYENKTLINSECISNDIYTL